LLGLEIGAAASKMGESRSDSAQRAGGAATIDYLNQGHSRPNYKK